MYAPHGTLAADTWNVSIARLAVSYRMSLRWLPTGARPPLSPVEMGSLKLDCIR